MSEALLAAVSDLSARPRARPLSPGAARALENAELAVREDPVRLAAESSARVASRRLWVGVVLSPTLEILEAWLRGEAPVELLDPAWVERLRRPRPNG